MTDDYICHLMQALARLRSSFWPRCILRQHNNTSRIFVILVLGVLGILWLCVTGGLAMATDFLRAMAFTLDPIRWIMPRMPVAAPVLATTILAPRCWRMDMWSDCLSKSKLLSRHDYHKATKQWSWFTWIDCNFGKWRWPSGAHSTAQDTAATNKVFEEDNHDAIPGTSTWPKILNRA